MQVNGLLPTGCSGVLLPRFLRPAVQSELWEKFEQEDTDGNFPDGTDKNRHREFQGGWSGGPD
ncbi:hypothetical protein NTGZN8_160092 [Candidatus Nitrotoga fabula]|uniref:Uncharacterized protein n=1 Tax=Candidatus Nitrotoga fabula TaxID=2182327 RepID=A0A916BBU3_9PROT|nr:hypothetical protein NTGZN8_160092 [Candidatus Nitrotoga fabula]